MTPKAAIVLVCWNNADLLTDCLESIAAQSYAHAWTILVDNGSADESVSVATATMPGITVIEAGYNAGFARGNNLGIARALEDPETRYVTLVNTDARLHADWLRSLVDFAEREQRVASLQGLTLDYADHDVIDSTHVFVDRSGYASQGHWQERVSVAAHSASRVFGVNAAACLFTREFIEAQPFDELFDESMFMYLEDVDVAARATVMGWTSYFVPDAIAYHLGSASTGGGTGKSRYAFYMTYRNNFGMLVKNLPWSILLKIMIRAPAADYRTIRGLLQAGERRTAGEVFRGRLVGLVRMPIYLRKRARLRKVRRVEPDELWSLMERGT